MTARAWGQDHHTGDEQGGRHLASYHDEDCDSHSSTICRDSDHLYPADSFLLVLVMLCSDLEIFLVSKRIVTVVFAAVQPYQRLQGILMAVLRNH